MYSSHFLKVNAACLVATESYYTLCHKHIFKDKNNNNSNDNYPHDRYI